MKILLLGHGVSNDGIKNYLDNYNIYYDYLNKEEVFDKYDIVVKSPGIPLDDKVFDVCGKNVISDIELVNMFDNRDMIAITGTNGKTTTTLLINEFLSKQRECAVCGNIGYPIGLCAMDEFDIFICETSSFQLEGCKNFKPKVAVLLNINPHHLDHHKSFKAYIEAKEKICMKQDENDYLIYNFDNVYCKEIAKKSKAKKISFSTKSMLTNCYIFANNIYLNNCKIMSLNKKKIDYNIENFMAACCAVSVYKFPLNRCKRIYKKFEKPLYRAQYLSNDIINDAKSTNPFSTIATLKTLSNVILICGGLYRGENMHVLTPYISTIKCVYAYGETKNLIMNFFNEFNIKCYIFDDLKSASLSALDEKKESTLLYSPMFASYDQYKDYTQRGKEFSDIINYYLK